MAKLSKHLRKQFLYERHYYCETAATSIICSVLTILNDRSKKAFKNSSKWKKGLSVLQIQICKTLFIQKNACEIHVSLNSSWHALLQWRWTGNFLGFVILWGNELQGCELYQQPEISRRNKNTLLRSTELQQLLCLLQSIWL